jgi:hypothetical protein
MANQTAAPHQLKHGLHLSLKTIEEAATGAFLAIEVEVCQCFPATAAALRAAISPNDAPLMLAFAETVQAMREGLAEDKRAEGN